MTIEKGDQTVSIKHPSGATVKILKYGATVISWKNSNGQEHLFLSDAAKLDGTKAVRGGIPLVFPVFGKSSHHPTASLPQHGFARTNVWRVTAEGENSVTFTLNDNDLSPDVKKLWDYEFSMDYTVEVNENELKTTLQVRNPGTEPWECKTLLHTYLRVPNVSEVGIEGLSGLKYQDKVLKKAIHEDSKQVKITGATDRVYESTPPSTTILQGTRPLFTMHRENFKDVVVWNPYIEGAAGMPDFEPKDGWKNMLCVEAGNVSDWIKMDPDASWTGSQIIKSHL